MRDFHMTEIQAMKYSLSRAHALVAFRSMDNPWCEMQIDGLGYLAQEALRSANY